MKNDGESLAGMRFCRPLHLLVARAPGLYFSEPSLSMKLLRRVLNRPYNSLFILNSPVACASLN
jgi:hypothetical protein